MKQKVEAAFSSAFRPKARLLQLLGDELIGSARLAVFELVKNAYDADAEEVRVTICGLDSNSPSIEVIDNGLGMTREVIRDIWLVPAHDHRAQQRIALKRTEKFRLPLGEKGLGRFAVHKLGDKIELVTRSKNSLEYVVVIDWNKLGKVKFLDEAMVKVESRIPLVFLDGTKFSTGTMIKISSLREKTWDRRTVRQLYRQVTSISSPFKEKSDVFKAYLEVPDYPEWLGNMPTVQTILDSAPWYFSFDVVDGLLSYDYEFRRVSGVSIEPRKKSEKRIPLLLPVFGTPVTDREGKALVGAKDGPSIKKVVADKDVMKGVGRISGKLYIYDKEKNFLPKLGDQTTWKEFIEENMGIRVYRDGIRVYNYGEPDDDWLGLDLRRVNLPTGRISRNISIGSIEISLEESSGLIEKTNREGFIDNDALRRFKRLVLGVIFIMEQERNLDKDRLRIATKPEADQVTNKIQKPLEELRKAAKKHHVDKVLDPYIRKIENDYNDFKDTMLRSGMTGLNLAIVFHEVQHGVRILYESIRSGKRIELLKTQALELMKVLDGFSELLRKGEKKEQGLRRLLVQLKSLNQPRFRGHGILFESPVLEREGIDINVSYIYSLVLSALNNAIDNSIFWLKVKWPEISDSKLQRKIFVDINTRDFPSGVAIVVADNGPGFRDDMESLIKPFFSRRPEGMGLGLYYCNLVMELVGGHLEFPDPKEISLPRGYGGAVVAFVFEKRR